MFNDIELRSSIPFAQGEPISHYCLGQLPCLILKFGKSDNSKTSTLVHISFWAKTTLALYG
jgi:hypothetical protein